MSILSLMKVDINLILGTTFNHCYSLDDGLPWEHNRNDMKYFREVTTRGKKNAIIMGRKTWETLPKPLPKRINIVLSSLPEEVVTKGGTKQCLVVESLYDALEKCFNEKYDNVFVIGGRRVWYEVLTKYWFFIKEIHHTVISNILDGDRKLYFDWKRYAPQGLSWEIGQVIEFMEIYKTEITQYNIVDNVKMNSDEHKYLDLMRKVLEEGEARGDRTGVGTYSLFSPPEIRYDLTNNKLPIFTTKKVVWEKGLIELLWFIAGETNSKILEKQNVNYWKGNSTREFLDQRGLTDYEEGELGPLYGWQFRRWGAEYPNKEGGIDQLKMIIEQIKNDPYSRRHILNMWNVSDLDKMALCPCHMMCQFYVSKDGYLDCKLYQRSADLFLGVPLNVFCYSMLTHMIAHMCGLKPRTFIHTFGDAHIYQNHKEQVLTQLSRKVYPTPTVKFTRSVEDIDDFKVEDVVVKEYMCHPFIKAKMAV